MKREPLGLPTLVMLVVAAMIGFGVFTSSGYALAALGNPARVLWAWVLCGFWALAGAVAYGALAKRVPLSGGEYLYLSRFIHPSIGFLAGWISLIAGFTAPIAGAAKAVVVYGFPTITDHAAASAVATLIIVIASFCHTARVGVGVFAQNAVVLLKLSAVVVLLVWAFGLTPSDAWQGGPLPSRDPNWWPGDWQGWITMAAAMSWIAFSYTGFNAAVYVAGESSQAQRNVPRAMVSATLLVMIVYVLLNAIFVLAPRSTDVVADDLAMKSVAATATLALGGPNMQALTRGIIALAVLSSVFGMLLAGPRVYLQMARDGVMPAFLNTKSEVPRTAILTQAALSIAVVWLAQLDQIIGYLGMTLSACSALTVATIWRIAAGDRSSDAIARPTWTEHLSAAVYIIGTLAMLGAVVAQGQRTGELVAVGATIVVGLGVLAAWRMLGGATLAKDVD